MMTKVEVKIGSESYPCRPTMGAMVRFKEATGKEVSQMKAEDLTDLCRYLYCCVQSACKVDGRKFDMPFIDFADGLEMDELSAWALALSSEASEDKKK